MHTSDILIDNFVIIVIKHIHAHTHQTALNLIRWMEVVDSVYAKESCKHTTTTTWENRAQHQPWLKVNPYSLKYIIVFVLVGFSTSSHLKCRVCVCMCNDDHITASSDCKYLRVWKLHSFRYKEKDGTEQHGKKRVSMKMNEYSTRNDFRLHIFFQFWSSCSILISFFEWTRFYCWLWIKIDFISLVHLMTMN